MSGSLGDLPIQLGDMVERDGDARWLEAALAFTDGGRLAMAIFLARDGAKEAVAVFAPPQRHVGWLAAVELELPGAPPDQLEIAGTFYARERSFPARVLRLGRAPKLDAAATVAIYRGPTDEMAVVAIDAERALAFAGERVAPDDYQVLGHPEG